MDLTEEEIAKIVKHYKARRKYDTERYHNVNKKNPEFVAKNRQRAKDHYKKYGQKKKDAYAQNKVLLSARSSYRYYKRTDRIELFKTRHPEKYQLLVDNGVAV